MKKKVLSEYYLLVILRGIGHSMVTATYVLFLLEHGLNLFEVNLVNVMFHITLFATEIPTGIFADVFGRKKSFVLSCFVGTAGMLAYAISDNFIGFVIAEIILAISQTLCSGAFQAWFIDKAKHHNCNVTLDQIFARSAQIGCVVGVIFAIVGSYSTRISITLPWYLSAAAFLLSGIVALFFKEEYFVKKKFSFKDGWASIKESITSSKKYCLKSKKFRFLILLAIFLSFALQPLNMFWQPFFKELTSKNISTGWIYSGIQISLFVGAWLAPKILKKYSAHRKILLATFLIIGVCIVLSASSETIVMSAIFFFLHEIARGVIKPIRSTYLHENIPQKQRATIESVDSLIAHFGSTTGLLVSGIVAQKFGVSFSWIVFGGILIIFTTLIYRNSKNESDGP